jgi:hypothetical protein
MAYGQPHEPAATLLRDVMSNGRDVGMRKDLTNDRVISELSQGIKRGCTRASWTHCALSSSGKRGSVLYS